MTTVCRLEATWTFYGGSGGVAMTQRVVVKSLNFQPSFGPDHFNIELQNTPMRNRP